MAETIDIKELNCLLQSTLGKIKILSYETNYLVPAGENYGGIILKLDVNIKDTNNTKTTLKLVAKLGPANEMLGKMFNIQHTFKREMIMYTDIIPTLIKFQREHGINEKYLLDVFPKCYGARMNLNYTEDILDDNAVIIFENLQALGYIMGNRMIGFDLKISKLILHNLARFHAIPLAIKALNPKLFNEKISVLKPGIFGENFTDEMKKTFLNELNSIIENINDCKNYAKKILYLVDNGFKFEERFVEPTSQYCTIAHHDLWVNNIMILKNNTKLSEAIKLIDLQMVCYGSLAHDLLFFLYSSVQQEVFNEQYNDLIKTYYDSFINCLLEFNVNVESFTWESFLQELDNIGPYQVSHIVIMLRPIFMEKDTVKDMSDMKADVLSELSNLNNKYTYKLRSVILDFAKRKWI